MPAKPSMSPGTMNLLVQSITRAPLGIGMVARGPTSVMRPFSTITMESGWSFAERPQSVTSMIVPPASTRGTGGTGGVGACDQARTEEKNVPPNHSRRIRASPIMKSVFCGLSHSEKGELCDKARLPRHFVEQTEPTSSTKTQERGNSQLTRDKRASLAAREQRHQ